MDPQILAIIRPDPIPFETLISDLMTSSNEQRSQAESLFNLCKERYPSTIVKKLVHLLEQSPRLEARAMSAILLRKLYKQTHTNTLVQDELPLWNSLSESTRVSLKNGIAALSEVINFIQSLESSSDRDRLQDLLPCMEHFSNVVLNGGNEAKAQKALVLLMKLAETEPGILTGQFVEVVESMLKIADAENLVEGTRHLAIEFVITLAEVREPAPEMMRELPEFISRLFTILMKMLSSNYNVGQECLHRLATTLRNLLESLRLEVRAMSAIVLRKLFELIDPNTWLESTRLLVKSGLLDCVENEQNKWILRKLSDTISVLAAKLADNSWPELMPFMFNRVASAEFLLQESALLIFARLAQYVGDSLWPHITLLHDVFMNRLGNVGSLDVRIAALIAVINFIQCLQSSSDRDRFQDLLPGMMRCLTEVLNDGDEATAQEALNLLIELVKTEPGFFRGHLVEVVGCMLHIAEAESLEEGTRHLAIEFVITLVEAREPAPEMMMKFPQLISGLFAILMRMLLDIEDDAEWDSAEDKDESSLFYRGLDPLYQKKKDESSNYNVGQNCLRRLATALGGKTILPVAYHPNQLPAYLAAPDHEWKKHLAALVALVQIAKRCSELMIPILEQVVTMVLKLFEDPCSRVRLAAISAIGQLSTYVGPSLQVQYHDRVLPALDFALNDVENPRVQAHAVSFVLIFSSHCRPDILPPYLERILNKLIIPPLTDQSDPNIKVLKLANSLEKSTDADIDAMSAISEELFIKELAVLTKGLVLCKLLRCVAKRRNRSVPESLCHTIATFYNALCIKTGWPGLFNFLNESASHGNDFLKEATMLILELLRFSTENRPISLDVYCACLENDNERIRIAAFRAAIVYIRCTMDADLVLPMTQLLTKGHEVTTQKALKLLIECAHQSKHLTKNFSGWHMVIPFVSSAIEIAGNRNIWTKETRHLAIDLVITLGEGILSNCELMINELFEILMLDINEAASYRLENEDDDDGESSTFSVLLKFLDRLAFRLDEDWRTQRYMDMDFVLSMTRVLTEGQEVTTQKALKLLIECAHHSKHLTKNFLGWQMVIPFVSSAIKIAGNRNILTKETRHLAIDLVITLGEGMLSNRELMINELFEILMLDINEAASYRLENEDDDDGESSTFSVLLKFLDRLAFRLDEDWRTQRYMDMDFVLSMTRVLTEGQEVTTQKALKLLLECAHHSKHLTKNFLGWQMVIPFVSSAIKIAGNRNILTKETRHLAIDLVFTLEEGMLSNRELMINELFEILMLDINEAASYRLENEDDDDGESSTFSVLMKFLDRLAFRLDKDAWTNLEKYLDAPEWYKRVVAINILARHSRVYLKVTEKDFNLLVNMVLAQFKYADKHVRLAAVKATDQLSIDLNQDLQLQVQYHGLVIHTLHQAVGDLNYPQVQKRAASLVRKISKNNPPDNLRPEMLQVALAELRF